MFIHLNPRLNRRRWSKRRPSTSPCATRRVPRWSKTLLLVDRIVCLYDGRRKPWVWRQALRYLQTEDPGSGSQSIMVGLYQGLLLWTKQSNPEISSDRGDCGFGECRWEGQCTREYTVGVWRLKLRLQMFDNKKQCPFFLTVSVFPCPGSDVLERQEGRCVLDTACLQGNIISAEFAQRLGFTEFRALRPREESGGTVATGNIHKVSGAIHVSWFHCTSAKVYRDMRFLVSESAQVDMVIGTHSIVRHQLISPPNLFVDINGEPGKS